MDGAWRWSLGLVYIVAVAAIWIAASYIVQSVVDGGVSPFLITYICNTLFIIYIPLAEITRFVEDHVEGTRLPGNDKIKNKNSAPQSGDLECVNLLPRSHPQEEKPASAAASHHEEEEPAEGRWNRTRVARVSLLICPFWFGAQLCFNLSLKYTTVTSNTILSSSSSLFTFLVSLVFLGEAFTWVKLAGVLLCMGGTVMVSLGDTEAGARAVASESPLLGDALALISALLYSVYITLIRKRLPDEEKGEGRASMAHFLGYLGLFNLCIFLLPPWFWNSQSWSPSVSSAGTSWVSSSAKVRLLDNVLSDYLWAKAVLLTSTTVATAGLTIQVPMAAVVDTLRGDPPHLTGFLGAAAAMAGFAGINIPSGGCCGSHSAVPTEASSPDSDPPSGDS
ncbi:unnamed protein product [Spirodela intermedia]|uniref:Uncharacterized protein n=1 Tax=Spirodela intermedia TaxID=51605 RepID=A0A7I8IXY9_SPIIN|nr:unnamed protein product [Spirodela intermedia]CAA6662572.1 unnamed protein product [Spirodela intermedia]